MNAHRLLALCIALAILSGSRALADDDSIRSCRLRSVGGGRAEFSLQLVGAGRGPLGVYWVDGAPRAPALYFSSAPYVRYDYSTFPPREVLTMIPRLAIPVASRILVLDCDYRGGAGLTRTVPIDLPADPAAGHVVFVALDRDAARDDAPADNVATVSLAGPDLSIVGRPVIEQRIGGNPNRRLRLTVTNSGFRRSAGASAEIVLALAAPDGTVTTTRTNVAIPDLAPGQSHELVIPYHYRASGSTCRVTVRCPGDILPTNDSRTTTLQ